MTPQMTDGCAFIGGEYVAARDAKISIFDWGFLHSDATYDVAHVKDGAFFQLPRHLDRFFHGVERLRLTLPHSRAEVERVLIECVRRSGLRDAYVEMIATRGFPAAGSRDPRRCDNQFYAFAIPYIQITAQTQPLRLVISQQTRIPPSSVDPRIKNYHWLDMVAALFEAYDRGGETAVLVDSDGALTEGPGFNLFALRDKTLATPAAGVLAGITRQTTMDIAAALGLRVEQRTLTADECRTADEVFITSTAGGIMPIGSVDGVTIGNGTCGALTQKMQQRYWEMHKDPRYITVIDYAPSGG